jgi:membrane fusion protein, multidrug efflux system
MNPRILFSTFFVFLLLACSAEKKEAGTIAKIPVKLIPVKQEEISVPIFSSGILAARDELLLSFKTGGVIKKIAANEGQHVKKGQLLAQLDLLEISAYKKQARAAFEKARRDLERVENLYRENVATLEQKQNAASAFDVAKANLDVAAFNEKHSMIIAPANGKVLKTFMDASELVGPGTPVIAFGSTDKAFILKVGLTDRDIVRIQKGDPAEIKFDAYPNEIFKANVTQISGTASPGSGTYEIELQLEENRINLFSGFIGKATIHPQVKQLVSMIPINALNGADENSGFVYTISENNLAHKQQIHIAFIMDDKVAFYNDLGLTNIINEGNAYLFEKSPVEITN